MFILLENGSLIDFKRLILSPLNKFLFSKSLDYKMIAFFAPDGFVLFFFTYEEEEKIIDKKEVFTSLQDCENWYYCILENHTCAEIIDHIKKEHLHTGDSNFTSARIRNKLLKINDDAFLIKEREEYNKKLSNTNATNEIIQNFLKFVYLHIIEFGDDHSKLDVFKQFLKDTLINTYENLNKGSNSRDYSFFMFYSKKMLDEFTYLSHHTFGQQNEMHRCLFKLLVLYLKPVLPHRFFVDATSNYELIPFSLLGKEG